jgi:L-fuconolactonase
MTDDVAVIRRRFGPEDLRPLLAERDVDRTVLVQTRSSLEETREFLATAAITDFVAGVVGWVDLTDPAAGRTLRALQSSAGGTKLVGIRHQVHDEQDPDWLLRNDVRRGLQAVGDAGLAYDFLVRPRELPAALRTARDFPEMRFIIDHIAKPPIRSGDDRAWAEAMASAGGLGNVYCKLSGIVTEADWATWEPGVLVPYVRRVVGWFGVDRLMFGSDWPVCLLAGSYARVMDALLYCLGDLPAEAKTKIFGTNAIRCYRLRGADPTPRVART